MTLRMGRTLSTALTGLLGLLCFLVGMLMEDPLTLCAAATLVLFSCVCCVWDIWSRA